MGLIPTLSNMLYPRPYSRDKDKNDCSSTKINYSTRKMRSKRNKTAMREWKKPSGQKLNKEATAPEDKFSNGFPPFQSTITYSCRWNIYLAGGWPPTFDFDIIFSSTSFSPDVFLGH
ncbi:hypothetical protein CEXT_22571 [Caerostris extrusa]|uniref:Uncharacterized protein n=1 Tax=Caerostris extrusa TaxID=172846 RepID=A0AAV4N3C9_CAEEX|nr:hypothetical protein CEXT_22571 [Caerostris extrusa]